MTKMSEQGLLLDPPKQRDRASLHQPRAILQLTRTRGDSQLADIGLSVNGGRGQAQIRVRAMASSLLPLGSRSRSSADGRTSPSGVRSGVLASAALPEERFVTCAGPVGPGTTSVRPVQRALGLRGGHPTKQLRLGGSSLVSRNFGSGHSIDQREGCCDHYERRNEARENDEVVLRPWRPKRNSNF